MLGPDALAWRDRHYGQSSCPQGRRRARENRGNRRNAAAPTPLFSRSQSDRAVLRKTQSSPAQVRRALHPRPLGSNRNNPPDLHSRRVQQLLHTRRIWAKMRGIRSNFIYHCLYNLLLTVEGQAPPKVFSFLDKYKNGIPPGVSVKIGEIKAKAIEHKFLDINAIFDQIVRPEIRDAFLHSDYILIEDELRLKHRGSQYARIRLPEVLELVQKTVDWFNLFMGLLAASRRSFPKGHRITGRKSPSGQNLGSVEVLVDERGFATGFQASDALPLW